MSHQWVALVVRVMKSWLRLIPKSGPPPSSYRQIDSPDLVLVTDDDSRELHPAGVVGGSAGASGAGEEIFYSPFDGDTHEECHHH